MENLELWEKVCKTDPAVTKGAKIGAMKITAICPQSQRKAATEQFGPFGIGWGVKDEEWSYLDIGETKLCHYTATFWYVLESSTQQNPRGEFPINANVKVAYKTQGQNSYIKVDDEFAKKVQTNAITKGLSALGFNSDVFEGKFDDNKYVAERKAEEAGQNPTRQDTQSGSSQQSGSTVTAKDSAVKACAAYSTVDIDAYLVANSDGQAKVFGDLKNDEQFRWLAGKAYGGDVTRWLEAR